MERAERKGMKKKYEEVKKSIDEAVQRNLEQMLRSGVVKSVRVLPALDACEACKKWEGKEIAIKKAIKNPPLPIKDCHHEKYGYCRCCYVAGSFLD